MILEGYNKNVGRFRLVPLNINSKNDFSFFKKVFGDKDVMKTVSLYDGNISNTKNIKCDFQKRSIGHKKYNLGSYKITNNNSDIIGLTSLLLIKKDKKDRPLFLEFEYFIKPNFWHKKIGTDVAKLLIAHGFKTFKTVKRIYATALTSNIPSQIIMHRLNFKYVGKRQRVGGGLVNLRYITKFRLILSRIKLLKRNTNYYIQLIKKLNAEKSIIEEYDINNL